MLRFIEKVFGRTGGKKQYEDDNDNHYHDSINEVDVPIFDVKKEKKEMGDGTLVFSYEIKAMKPNMCFICKETYESDEHFAYLKKLCYLWLGWDDLNILTMMTNQPHRYRRYCKSCVMRTLLSQIKESRKVEWNNDKITFRCQFCIDYPIDVENEDDESDPEFDHGHRIKEENVIELLSEDAESIEEYVRVRKIFVAHHDINNKFCPVVDCEFYVRDKNAKRIECPEHGNYCIKCSEKCIETEKHKCAGIHKELKKLTNLKRCTRCNSLVEKNGGCSHVICKCGHGFNWNHAESASNRKRKV